MMSLTHIPRLCTGCYKLNKSLEEISHLMYMDDIKLFVKKRKRIGSFNTGSENIQSAHWDGSWHRTMRHANKERQKTTHDDRNQSTESRKKLER